MTVYADPPVVPALAQLASAGAAANPYDVNTHWRNAIMALKDLLDGTEPHNADYLFRPGAANDFRIRLGDAAGARSVIFEDSTPATVFSVDSDGNMNAIGQTTLPTTGVGAGIVVGGDVHLYRGAANRMDLAAGDSWRVQNAAGEYATIQALAARCQLEMDNDNVNDVVWVAKLLADVAGRILLRTGGQVCWGDGTNPVDTKIERGAANRLDVVAGDAFVITGGAGDFAAPVNGMLWYNTTTGKMRVYESGAWADVV